MAMEIVILPDYDAVAREAARRVVALALQKPHAVLALPTGKTPLRFYNLLINYTKLGLVTFENITIFNLDEFLDLPKNHPSSYFNYMQKHLLTCVKVGRHYIPNSEAADPEEECKRYEDLIAQAGSIDLAVLGLGLNGHIGFNEPGTPFESRTHVATLTHQTREGLASEFGGLEYTPTRAITMGIKTIMNAKNIILMATGAEKAKILERALFGPITPDTPASVLQLHPSLTVLVDHQAASSISAYLKTQDISKKVSRDC